MTLNLKQIITALDLQVFTASGNIDEIIPSSGYASDLLSCVMAGAKQNGIWITLQAHANIVAVAALLEICAVIITENAQPDAATLEKANQQGVTLLSTPLATYQVIGRLWELGLQEG